MSAGEPSDPGPGTPAGVPAGHYAKRGASRRALVPLAAVLSVLGVAGAGYGAWVYVHRTSGHVVKFQTSDGGVQITANVRREPGRETECALRARNYDGAEVGRRVIVIPPGEGRKVTIEEFLATSERPVTGEIQQCRSR